MRKEKIRIFPEVGGVFISYQSMMCGPKFLEEFGVSMPTIRRAQFWVGYYEETVPTNSFDTPGKGKTLQFWRFFIELEKYAVEEIYKELHERFEIEYGPTLIPEQFHEELKDLITSQQGLLERLKRGEFSPITQ